MGVDLTGIGSVADFAKSLMDRFFPPDASPEQRVAMQAALESSVAIRDQAKGKIIASEMGQDDNYTKRARPTVVYAGLVMIAINHVIFPIISRLVALMTDPIIVNGKSVNLPPELFNPVSLPGEFWWAWGGVVSVWVLGRSAEKRADGGNLEKLTKIITGAK